MKRIKPLLTTAIAALLIPCSLNSCTTFNAQPKNDAATGALIGAGLGAAVAGDDDRLKGAALGGVLGGAAGYGIGKARE